MSGSDIILFKSTNGGRSYRQAGARQPGCRQRRRRPVPALDGRHAVRPGQRLVLRPPQRPRELLHRHVAGALGGRRADVHRPPRLAADVGSGRQRADLGVGQVHRRLPGPRRRRRGGDPVLERHAAREPAGERQGALALPGGLRRARARATPRTSRRAASRARCASARARSARCRCARRATSSAGASARPRARRAACCATASRAAAASSPRSTPRAASPWRRRPRAGTGA